MNLPPLLTDHPDGEIRLTGHRIGLYTVIRLFREGSDVDAILEELPSLSREKVAGVLTFYEQNREEVDAYCDAFGRDLERQEARYPAGPSLEELRRRWVEKGLGPPP